MLTFDFTFHDPFSESGTQAGSDARLPVAIGSRSYLVELKNYRRRTLPALREPVDQSSEPGDHSLNTQGLWDKTQWDWRHGAGQNYLDLDASIRSRFYNSKGIDVWNERYIQLLSDTSLVLASANTNLKGFQVNNYAYIVDGTNLRYGTDPTSLSAVAIGGTIKSVTTDGTSVWTTVSGSPPKKGAIGSGTFSAFGAINQDYIAYANGRLLGMAAGRIFEQDAAGALVASSLDYTHKNTGFAWLGALGTPNGIYAFGSANDIGEIYFIDVDPATGGLKVPVFAGSTPIGETLYDLAFYEGAVAYGTSKGIRVAKTSDQTFALQHGPLLPITGGVRSFDMQGQYIWFTWTNYDSTSTGLGRMDLSIFTDTLVPAYASDLMATTQGTVQDVFTLGTKRYFLVSGVGLYGEAATKVASGTLRTGKMLYGTFVPKNVSTLDLRCNALPTGGSIVTEIAGDSGSWSTILNLTQVGAMYPPTTVGVSISTNEEIELRFTLNRATDTTVSPVLKRWTLQAIAAPVRTDEFIVPLIMYTTVKSEAADQNFEFPVLDEFLYLKNLEATGQIINYREGNAGRSYSVYVDQVELQPADWTDETDFFNGQIVCRLLSVRSLASGSPT